MFRFARRTLVCVAITAATAASLVAAERASAGDAASAEATAAERFAEGEKAFKRGDFVKAGEAFDAAYAAKPHESALWNAARSWERAGELARAANLYRKYLRSAPDDAPDRKRAGGALDVLVAKIGRLEIVAPDLGGITVDGAAIEGNSVFVSPGTHIVEAKSQGGDLVRGTTSVAAGAVESVLLAPARPNATAAPVASSSASSAPTAAPSLSAHATPTAAPPSGTAGSSAREAPRRRGASPLLLLPFAGLTLVSTTVLVVSGIDVLKAKSDYDDLKKGRSAEAQQQLIDDGVYKTDRTNVVIGITAGLAVITGVVALAAIDWKPAAQAATKSSREPEVGARWQLLLGAGGASLEATY